ncbi:MAG: PIN domain-containing protein [Asticcacaulis sp.]
MTLYLLDTHIVSKMFLAKPPHLEAIKSKPITDIGISVVTEAELLYGLQKRSPSSGLVTAIHLFLRTTEILAWNSETALAFARLKVAVQQDGIGIAPLDLMIAAQALATGATLVTNDGALKRLGHVLPVEDWTA